MAKKKIVLIVVIVLAILLIVGTFFYTKDKYYDKGKIDQSVIIMNGLVGSAINCQPINIPLDDENVVQLINPQCL